MSEDQKTAGSAPPEPVRPKRQTASEEGTRKESGDEPEKNHSPAAARKNTTILLWSRIKKLFEAIPKITKVLAILVFVALLSLVTYRELNKNAVIIEPFEVPGALASKGYTGRAMANKFIDQVNVVRRRASTTMQSLHFTGAWMETEPEIHVPQGGEFLESILTNIKNYFGEDTVRINGEVVLHDDTLQVTTRVSGQPAKTVSGKLEDLNAILLQNAEHIYLYTQPYILASYLYDIDKQRSVETIRHVLRQPPPDDDAWAYNLWGLILYDQNDLKGAIAKFQKALDIRTSDIGAHAHAYSNWGLALRRQGDYEKAVEMYQKAIDLDSTHVQAYNGWGRALEEQGDVAGAVDKYRTAVDIDPRDDDAYFNWGTALLLQGDTSAAIEQYQRVVEINPDAALAYNNWGRALEEQGDLRGAVERYHTATTVAPADPIAYLNWGALLLVQKNYNAAVEKYRRVIEINPNTAQAYNYWGRALEEQGDVDGAIEKYRQAVELAPEDDRVYLNWGNALFARGDFKQAADRYRKAVSLNENNTGARFNLGVSMAELGNHAAAIAAFRRIIELEPDSQTALHAQNAIDALAESQN